MLKDAITFLRVYIHYDKPNWDCLFASIVEKPPETDVGVLSPFFNFWVEMMVSTILFDLVLLWTSGSFEPDSSNVEQLL